MVLIKAINSKEQCWAWYGNLVEDAKQILKNRLWGIKFVHREGNNAAHVLAKFGLSLYEETIWMEEVPLVISQIVPYEIPNQ